MKKTVRRVGLAITRFFRAREHSGALGIASSLSDSRTSARMGAETAGSDFFDKLRAILSENGGAAQAGRINVIGLDRIKAKLGDRWDQLRERVHAVARVALQKCLHPADVWTACGDSYVIAFSQLSITEAQTKCRMIARIIETALLGEGDSQGLCVAAAVATVDGKVLLRDLPALDAMLAQLPPIEPTDQPISPSSRPAAASEEAPAAIQDLPSREPLWAAMNERAPRGENAWVENKDLFLRNGTGPNASMEDWPLQVEEHASASSDALNRDLRIDRTTSIGDVSWSTTERPRSAASLSRAPEEYSEIEPRNPANGPGVMLTPTRAAWPKVQETRETTVRDPCVADESLEMVTVEADKEDEICWEPLWDVPHQRIPIYRARYVRNSRIWLQEPNDEMLARVDFALRETVLRELTGCMVQSRYILLGLPVRFWTIASYAARRQYLAAFAHRVSPASRKFLLMFITDVPDGVPAGRLLELLSTVRRYCREVVVETTLHPSDFAAFSSARVFAVGTDLTGSSESERVQMLQIDQFARGAAKAGITNSCLAGVQSMPVVTAAIAAGFRYISGPAVASFAPQVSNVRPLGVDYVYRVNLEAKGLLLPTPEQGAA